MRCGSVGVLQQVSAEAPCVAHASAACREHESYCSAGPRLFERHSRDATRTSRCLHLFACTTIDVHCAWPQAFPAPTLDMFSLGKATVPLQPTHPHQPNPCHPSVHWRVPSTAVRGVRGESISPPARLPLAALGPSCTWREGVLHASFVEVQAWISIRSMGECINCEVSDSSPARPSAALVQP